VVGNGTDFVSAGLSAASAGTSAAAGILQLATNIEAVTGTNTAKAVTPDDLTARLAAPGAIGGTTPAAGTSPR